MSSEDRVAALEAELAVEKFGAAYEAATEVYRNNPTEETKAAYQEARDNLQAARSEAKANRPAPEPAEGDAVATPETLSTGTTVHQPGGDA